MKNKFAVIGLGDFGMSVATNLAENGVDVIAVDHDLEVIEEIKDKVAYAVRMDSTDEKALKSLGIDKVDAVIISIGTHFEDTILTSVLLLQMGAKKVVARASTKIQEKILKRLGVHQVIIPEFEIAKRLANNLIHEDILEYIPLDENYNIVQIAAPKMFIGKTLQELDLRIKYNVNLITIKRNHIIQDEETGNKITKPRIYGVPTSSTLIEDNDILILLGKDRDIKKVIE
ncbi:MAG: TrkA family potassium uptake protein [Ignavibacteriaceae bacterium]|nr:TrkA family potassium uptake protein [Ignavibacteriaceae bacterium]